MIRHPLIWIVLLASALHALGMARSPLPAQDGLKLIQSARQFRSRPWADVIRGTDRHPLAPALIALVQPVIARVIGPGPDSWRIAAQGVSTLASLALVVVLYRLTRSLFDNRTAALAALLWTLLPLPAEVGHDTLSDALGLLGIVLSLHLGALALQRRGLAAPIGCGLVSGLAFLARPEALVAPVAVLIAAGGTFWTSRREFGASRRAESVRIPLEHKNFLEAGGSPPVRFAALAVAFLAMVGSYALIKGEVSEKLAVRQGLGLSPSAPPTRKASPWLPPGLDNPRWDFSAKEESDHPAHLSFRVSISRLLTRWAEGLGWILAPLALWGAWWLKAQEGSGPARGLIALYVCLFAAVLVRHAMGLGYLSDRHTLSLVALSLPWAAAATLARSERFLGRLGCGEDWARRWGIAALVGVIGVGITVQVLKPGHPSRWGHQQAGRWLAEHARDTDAVLDTRGWASFVRDRDGYDYWHVRQALTDPKLAYVVVGADELAASSPRASTLRAVLAFAAEAVADFPEREGGREAGVLVYRFHPPRSWEGLTP